MRFLLYLLPFAGFVFFASRRLPRYLHIFQQEEYDAKRFLPWLWRTKAFDKRVSLALLGAGLAAMAFPDLKVLFSFALPVAIFAGFGGWEPDPKLEAKKKLVMTDRAKRIFGVALALCVVAGLAAIPAGSAFCWIIPVQMLPLLLCLGNTLLTPYEDSVQKRIMKEASERFAQINPVVIGITGSFGKTSVKHILGHVLEMNAPTLYTPGSVNTLMGISRIIRETLQPNCKFFIVEMGAYGEGSIKRLCDLTPPSFGIITAIGEAHYERFKTLDTVARAKFELSEAVLSHPSGGQMVIHDQVLGQEYARDFVAKHPGKFITCGASAPDDVHIDNVEQSASGLTVGIHHKGAAYTLFAPLFGVHHAGNIVLAFASAVALGIEPGRAIAALRTTPQIKHRLEVKPLSDGTIHIDDAFNSNPSGFLSAIELMSKLAAEKGGRRILVTPGVAELGAKHDDAHKELGAQSAGLVDVALVVRPDRIPTFLEGFKAANTDKVLQPVANLAEAQKWLKENGKPNDIILFENDLPDVYERKLSL
jgi:UDP-N-acetylmuramoyl-tripeptide--D-alanyl-D-alanine ligase